MTDLRFLSYEDIRKEEATSREEDLVTQNQGSTLINSQNSKKMVQVTS